MIATIRIHFNHLFAQVGIHFNSPQTSIHVPHSIAYSHLYIWSSYPSPKPAKIDYSELFSFDLPSAFLFLCSLVGAVALMKLFTFLSSKLGVGTVSEEPVGIPFRVRISDVGNVKRLFSPGVSFKLLFLIHGVFGLFVL